VHKTLEAETARPPATTFSAQQCRFTAFRQEYDTERPHEALANKADYEWLARFAEDGRQALRDRSRAPHSCPHRIATATAESICAVRRPGFAVNRPTSEPSTTKIRRDGARHQPLRFSGRALLRVGGTGLGHAKATRPDHRRTQRVDNYASSAWCSIRPCTYGCARRPVELPRGGPRRHTATSWRCRLTVDAGACHSPTVN
jgi:hypothetical protein